MGWLPPFAQNAKGWRTKLSSRSLCQHERGRSRLHRRERNFADSRVRTTRTSWIVNSRFLAAEAARNDNEKGKLFGTLRPRSGQAQGLKSCPSRNNGISRTGRVRTTRTNWIVNSRLLAAEAARNDNEKGKLFGTLGLAQGRLKD